jgi:nanoRNase/pAp phosphatase (c-di-AMP/oligoRNAs hydrolase)
MIGPIGKSVSTVEKYQKLRRAAGAGDTLAILVNADPDALASALALKRLFWRKVEPVTIFLINFRNAGFRRNAGKMAHKLFGEVGSAGGHAQSARAEVPLENIDCGSGSGSDCRRYVLRQIRKMSGAGN